jgi:hypothetical protein
MTSSGEQHPRSDSPTVAELLPRAAEAYTAPEKLGWILSEEGHWREWARVLHIGPNDAQRFWSAIAHAVLNAPIYKITDREPHGTVCGVETILTIDKRTAKARTFWHYEHAGDVPRLVTAYPVR